MPEPGLALYSHRGTPAIQRLVEFAPSTGGLSLWVEHRDVDDDDAPLVQTDGRCIRYGAAFEAQPLPVQAALVAHEVLHIALRHPQRYLELQHLLGDVDLQLFNICADAIVNSALGHLGWLQLPARSVLLEDLLSSALRIGTPVDSALLQWDVERLYRAIDDRGARGSGKSKQRQSARRWQRQRRRARRRPGVGAGARVRPRQPARPGARPAGQQHARRRSRGHPRVVRKVDARPCRRRRTFAAARAAGRPAAQPHALGAGAAHPAGARAVAAAQPVVVAAVAFVPGQPGPPGRAPAHALRARFQPEQACAAPGAGGGRVGLDRRHADGALRARDRSHHPPHRSRPGAGDRRRARAPGRRCSSRAAPACARSSSKAAAAPTSRRCWKKPRAMRRTAWSC